MRYRRPHPLIPVPTPSAFGSPRCISNEPPAPPYAAANEPGKPNLAPRPRPRLGFGVFFVSALSLYPAPRVVRPQCPPTRMFSVPRFRPRYSWARLPNHSNTAPSPTLTSHSGQGARFRCMHAVRGVWARVSCGALASSSMTVGASSPVLRLPQARSSETRVSTPPTSRSRPFALCRARWRGRLGQRKRISLVP